MATKPGGGSNSNRQDNNRSIPSRDSGLAQDKKPHSIPGRVLEDLQDTTVSRVQPRRNGGGGSSGGGSNGK